MGNGASGFPETFLFFIVGVIGCGPRTEAETEEVGSSACDLEPCGGELVGSWQAQKACSPADLVVNMQAAVSQPACRDLFRKAVLTASGVAEFQNTGTATSTLALVVDWSLMLTEACAAALTNQPSVESSSTFCTQYANDVPRLAGTPFASATCQHVSGGCDCQAQSIYAEASPGTFRIVGTEFVNQEGKHFPYCAGQNTLAFQVQDDAGGSGFVVQLARR
jgi:hypothetical protein